MKAKGTKTLPPASQPPDTPGVFTDLETDDDFDEDDETNDPNWRCTPLLNIRPPKVEISVLSHAGMWKRGEGDQAWELTEAAQISKLGHLDMRGKEYTAKFLFFLFEQCFLKWFTPILQWNIVRNGVQPETVAFAVL